MIVMIVCEVEHHKKFSVKNLFISDLEFIINRQREILLDTFGTHKQTKKSNVHRNFLRE